MIEKSIFDDKMREFKNLRGIQMTEGVKDSIYQRAKNWTIKAFDLAIEELIYDQDKFTFARMAQVYWKHSNNIREKEWVAQKEKEKKSADEFFNPVDEPICNRQKCKDCHRIENCRIRGREWQKGIAWVLAAPKGEGSKRAEEITSYMNEDFMGGVGR